MTVFGAMKLVVTIALLLQSATAASSSRTKANPKICPILGPSFPYPTNIAASKTFQDAANALDKIIDTGLKTGHSPIGNLVFNQTTFSVSAYSSLDEGLAWQYHFTSNATKNSPVGVREVNADSVYLIGSISKLMTMYTFLALDGDQKLNDVVAEWVPELVELQKNVTVYGTLPNWNEITISDLAAQSSGIDSDYGADDIEFGGGARGLPKLPKSRIPICNIGDNAHYKGCNQQQDIAGLAQQPAIFAAAHTPSYSNAGYDILSFVFEKILEEPFSQSFHRALVQGLGLTHTWYGVPPNTSVGAIPVGVVRSGWEDELKSGNPDGGNAMSTNDMATVGKSMLNSTLLPPAVTRRWIKPRTFTSAMNMDVGQPWEIYRWQTPNKIYDLYTKDGGNGNYGSTFGIIPDLNFGFTVLTTGRFFEPNVQAGLANLIGLYFLPAVEQVGREQAQANFGGRYSNSKMNSSIVIETDEQPGLRVTEWMSNGKNVFKDLDNPGPGSVFDFRLWPNLLYNGTTVGFTASWQVLPQHDRDVPMPQGCGTWDNTGYTQFGNVPLGLFTFTVGTDGKATSVLLNALPITLTKDS